VVVQPSLQFGHPFHRLHQNPSTCPACDQPEVSTPTPFTDPDPAAYRLFSYVQKSR